MSKIMFLSEDFLNKNYYLQYFFVYLLVILSTFVGYIPFWVVTNLHLSANNMPYPMTETEWMHILDKNLTLFLLLLSFGFVFLAIYFSVKKILQQSWTRFLTSRQKLDWNRIFFSFSLYSILQIVLFSIGYFTNPEGLELQFQWHTFLTLLLIACIMIPIQTSTEEIMFRALALQGFAVLTKHRGLAWILSSVIFGLLHISNPEVSKIGNFIMIYYIGTGLFLGLITLMDNGTELALGFHASNNLIGALLVTSPWSVLDTDAIFIDYSEPNLWEQVFFPVFFIFPIFIYIFSKKYKWSDWKYKLFSKLD